MKIIKIIALTLMLALGIVSCSKPELSTNHQLQVQTYGGISQGTLLINYIVYASDFNNYTIPVHTGDKVQVNGMGYSTSSGVNYFHTIL